MATRGGEVVCPACARGALTPEGTWVTTPGTGRMGRGRRRRPQRATVRPPTHGEAASDRAATLYPGWAAAGEPWKPWSQGGKRTGPKHRPGEGLGVQQPPPAPGLSATPGAPQVTYAPPLGGREGPWPKKKGT